MDLVPGNPVIAVVGLGYVGLPLAVEFCKRYRTVGFDLSQSKIDAYLRYEDPTGEVGADSLTADIKDKGLELTTDPRCLASADVVIVG